MTHRCHCLKRGIAALVFVAASITSISASAGAVVYVADVQHLYAAVNDDRNAGATVLLAPGVYVLSAEADPQNGGRLDLQLDMSLVGVEGDLRAVTIDASALPQSSFAFTVGRTGIIRTGRGNNAIEWLTIIGNPLAAASISTDLVETDRRCGHGHQPGPCRTTIRVANVAAGNSARGVDIRNATVNTKGRRIVAKIEESEFYWGVEGIRVANFVEADDGQITVDMRSNHSHKNRLGCIIENNRSSNTSIVVRSDRDLFDDNGLGCMIGGGLVGSGSANFNTTRFDAHESLFTNNTRTVFNTAAGGPLFTDTGGVVVIGAELLSTGAPDSTSGNTAIVRLWDCQIAGNHLEGRNDFEFQAFGARSELDPPALAGTNNHALIQLRGSSALVEVVAVDSEPPDPSGTNTVTVVRIPQNRPAWVALLPSW
jgi:hypothetical protein